MVGKQCAPQERVVEVEPGEVLLRQAPTAMGTEALGPLVNMEIDGLVEQEEKALGVEAAAFRLMQCMVQKDQRWPCNHMMHNTIRMPHTSYPH